MTEGVKKHAIVLVVAFLFATYHIVQLESGRNNHRANVEEDFDRAVRALRESLPASKYQVQITQPVGATAQALSRRALVINREFAVPRIEGELYIDQQRASDQRKRQPQRGRGASTAHSGLKPAVGAPIRFRAYDPTAMETVAKKLLQRQLIAVIE